MDSEWRFNPPCPWGPTLQRVSDLEGGTADPVVRTAITTDDLPALHRHIAVVGQVLVDHRHGEIREGAVAIPRHRIEQSESRPALGAASDFRGVQELFSIADPPAVEGAGLVEQLGALREELAVLIEPDLIRTEVQHEVVRHHLPEVGHEGHVKRERVADAHLHVESPVDTGHRFGPLGVEVGAGIGVQAESRWRGDALRCR